MTELNTRMIQACLFAQGFMLRALAATHPSKDNLRSAYLHYINQFFAEAPGIQRDPEFDRMLRIHCDQQLDEIL